MAETAAEKNRVIVMAIGVGKTSKTAFRWLLDNVYRDGDLVVLTHCPEPDEFSSLVFQRRSTVHRKSTVANAANEAYKPHECELDKVWEQAEQLSEEYRKICQARKVNYKMHGGTNINPAEVIIEIAHEEHASIVCCGAHGHSAVKRTLKGSISDYLVQHLQDVPLIVVNQE